MAKFRPGRYAKPGKTDARGDEGRKDCEWLTKVEVCRVVCELGAFLRMMIAHQDIIFLKSRAHLPCSM